MTDVPTLQTPGARLFYECHGQGEPVVLITGAAAKWTLWEAQIPPLVRAGYQVVVFDHRGTPPSSTPGTPFGLSDLVGDTAALIDQLGLAPCRLAGFSLGALIAQELAACQPDLVRAAALLATRARTDTFRAAQIQGIVDYLGQPATMPPTYHAAVTAMQMLSPATLAQDLVVRDWLDLFTFSPARGPGARAQHLATAIDDRREMLAGTLVACLVVSFADDLLAPPALGREAAEAIPDCRFVVVPHCGHLGLVEQPEAVSDLLLDFFAEQRSPAA